MVNESGRVTVDSDRISAALQVTGTRLTQLRPHHTAWFVRIASDIGVVDDQRGHVGNSTHLSTTVTQLAAQSLSKGL